MEIRRKEIYMDILLKETRLCVQLYTYIHDCTSVVLRSISIVCVHIRVHTLVDLHA